MKSPKGIFLEILSMAILLLFIHQAFPGIPQAEEMSREGWTVPDLRGLIPYSILLQKVDGIEKMIERFYTPGGGHVARISGNGKVFAYAVDSNLEPPIDYLLLDVEGFGKFTKKLKADEVYSIPEWVFR